MNTLLGMAHTLSAMGMIINRSVDFVRESAGKEAMPHIVPVDLPRLLGNVVDFMKWQAEDTAIQVDNKHVCVIPCHPSSQHSLITLSSLSLIPSSQHSHPCLSTPPSFFQSFLIISFSHSSIISGSQ